MASHIERRKFLATLGGAAVAWPLAARAQQMRRIRRIGVLMSQAADDPEGPARMAGVLQSLQQLGWTEGRNLRIETRWSSGDADSPMRRPFISVARSMAITTRRMPMASEPMASKRALSTTQL